MHSDWKFWEFFKSEINVFSTDKNVLCFSLSHPIFEKFVAEDLKKRFAALSIVENSKVNKDWIEQNLISLGLFDFQNERGGQLVYGAEQFDADLKSMLLERGQDIQKHCLILFFNRKDDFFKQLSKREWVTAITVQEPKFWEFDKVLKVLADRMKLRLDYGAEQFIVDNVENSIGQFYDSLERIRQMYGDERVLKSDDVAKIIEKTRLDVFAVARTYSKKQFLKFYDELLLKYKDFKQLEEIFRFLISHLIKMADPSYVEKKDRPSKYDKEVLSYAKFWKGSEIQKELILLNNFLVLAKSKDDQLFNILLSVSLEREVAKNL